MSPAAGKPQIQESAFERRLQIAKSMGGDLIEYCENVPKWPSYPISQAWPPSTSYPPSAGSPALLEALAAQQRGRGAGIDSGNLLITNGALHGLGLAFRFLGGPVACQTPLFSGIFQQLQLMGLSPTLLPVWPDGAAGLRRLLASGLGARTIYVNTPNNPTGKCLTTEEQRILMDYCGETGTNLVVDLVYEEYSFGEPRFELPPLDDYPNVVVVNSFSKNYGAPDIRVGWIASSHENIGQLVAALEADCIAVAGCAQAHALALLSLGNGPLLQRVAAGRSLLPHLIGPDAPGRLIQPKAGTMFYLEVDFENIGDFADYLLSAYGLLFSTSENYAACSRPHVRLPLGYPEDTIRKAVPLLLDAVSAWRAKSEVLNRRIDRRNPRVELSA